jgi:hypothetical protein
MAMTVGTVMNTDEMNEALRSVGYGPFTQRSLTGTTKRTSKRNAFVAKTNDNILHPTFGPRIIYLHDKAYKKHFFTEHASSGRSVTMPLFEKLGVKKFRFLGMHSFADATSDIVYAKVLVDCYLS